MPSRRTIAILLLAATLPSGHPLPVARADILRVQASGCAGDRGSRVGTGFAWHSSKEVVTALHVVAGCQRLTVYSERDGQTYKVNVSRVLRRADLALIAVDGNVTFPPIVESAGQPTANTDLTAWGYGEGIPSMRDFRPLRVANGAPTLQQNIPSEVATELARAGSPALNITVVPIDAPLAPGLSGAPLLDATGRVRAIADGGVSHGITHVSWAIPVQYLTELLQSTESATAFSTPNANLSAAEVTRADVFAADFVAENVKTVNCGTARLRMTRTLSLSEAEIGNDSPLGMQQLKSIIPFNPSTLKFDVYEDASSGATVAVPSGVPLTTFSPASCMASMLNGLINIVVSVTTVPPGSNPDLLSSQFEAHAAPPPIFNWVPDVAWSYIMPFYRPDGLVVRRKAFMHMVPNALNTSTEYLFETLAARNGAFVGVAAVRRSDLQVQLCQRGMVPPQQCPPASYFPVWAHAALSVQLATFAISASNPNLAAWQQTGRGGP
ncbi:MAG: serine protease [bacterium]